MCILLTLKRAALHGITVNGSQPNGNAEGLRKCATAFLRYALTFCLKTPPLAL
jgi:hypothetical protein